MNKVQDDNPDRAVIAEAVATGSTNLDFPDAPLLGGLNCKLQSARHGKVELRFNPGALYVQGNGVISGGIVATMLDFGLAFAALTICEAGESTASVGLNVSYLAPVTPGPVLVHAELLSTGYRLVQAEARLMDLGGQQLAIASSPLAMKRLK